MKNCYKSRFFIPSIVIILIFLYFVGYDLVWAVLHLAIFPSRLTHLQENNMKRYDIFRSEERKVYPRADGPIWKAIEPTYLLLEELRKDQSSLPKLRERCYKLPQIEQLADIECRAEWLYTLETNEVVGTGTLLGFQFGKKAGMVVKLEGGRKAMFKACGSGNEWPENEVRASHLDYAIGFNTAPPTIMRNITYDTLQSFISPLSSDTIALQQMRDTCSDNGVFFGAMIGWFDDLVGTETVRKRLDSANNWDPEEIRKYRSLPQDYVAEIVQNHFFFYIIGTLRDLGYNEYKLSESNTVVTVDLDRAKFDGVNRYNTQRLTSCHLCKFKQSTIERLQAGAEDDALSEAIQLSLAYDPFQLVFSHMEAKGVQSRLDRLLTECVNPCFEKYGMEDVIIPG